MPSETFTRPLTTGDAVVQEIRRLLLSGEFKPGTPLRQAALADQLGVSRLPVREALNTLQAEGQVEHIPHKGFVVARLNLEELQDVYRLRSLLEGDAMSQAFRRGIPESVIRVMQQQQDAMRLVGSDDVAEAARINKVFHFAIFEASGSRHQVRLIRQLWDATDAYRALYYSSADHLTSVLDEHDTILEGVKVGDEETVVAACVAHRQGTLQILGRAFGDTSG